MIATRTKHGPKVEEMIAEIAFHIGELNLSRTGFHAVGDTGGDLEAAQRIEVLTDLLKDISKVIEEIDQ